MKTSPIRLAIAAMALLLVGAVIAYFAGLGGAPSNEIERLYEAPPEGATRVLFIGNSYTYRHDVPGMMQRIAGASGEAYWVEQWVAGGANLEEHWGHLDLREQIQEGDWDYVVLQEQSLRPVLEPNGYLSSLDSFSDLARKYGAEPVIFATWARARWNDFYSQGGRYSDSSKLRDALEATFRDAETNTKATLAPVGTAWLAFRRQHAATPLHSKDGSHATREGAYLAAAVLYRTLSGKDVVGNAYVPGDMSPATVEALQRSADDSQERWRKRWDEQGPEQPSVHPGAEPARSPDAGGADTTSAPAR